MPDYMIHCSTTISHTLIVRANSEEDVHSYYDESDCTEFEAGYEDGWEFHEIEELDRMPDNQIAVDLTATTEPPDNGPLRHPTYTRLPTELFAPTQQPPLDYFAKKTAERKLKKKYQKLKEGLSLKMIEKILTLSTAHMPNEEPDFKNLLSISFPYGEVVFVSELEDKPEAGVPEWILPAMQLAHKNKCTLILFDRDAEEDETLPRWDW